jgi:hypothetical protein
MERYATAGVALLILSTFPWTKTVSSTLIYIRYILILSSLLSLLCVPFSKGIPRKILRLPTYFPQFPTEMDGQTMSQNKCQHQTSTVQAVLTECVHMNSSISIWCFMFLADQIVQCNRQYNAGRWNNTDMTSQYPCPLILHKSRDSHNKSRIYQFCCYMTYGRVCCEAYGVLKGRVCLKTRAEKWAAQVTRVWEKQNAYQISVGKSEGNRRRDRRRDRWKDNIKMDIQ